MLRAGGGGTGGDGAFGENTCAFLRPGWGQGKGGKGRGKETVSKTVWAGLVERPAIHELHIGAEGGKTQKNGRDGSPNEPAKTARGKRTYNR